MEHDRRAASLARVQSLGADEPLVFEHLEVIPHGVERNSALLGQGTGTASRCLLDGAKQSEPTRLRQSAEVMGTAGHVVRLDGRERPRHPFDRK